MISCSQCILSVSIVYTVDLVILVCLNFRKFVILGLFMKSRICELMILMIYSAHNNHFREILKLTNLSSLQIS